MCLRGSHSTYRPPIINEPTDLAWLGAYNKVRMLLFYDTLFICMYYYVNNSHEPIAD